VECAGAGLLVRRVFERLGLDLSAITFSGNGKPLHEKICFNLSHSEGIAVLAVASTPVGCDVERVRKTPQKVLNGLSESEREWINGDDRAFFRLWTGKESYLKFTGEGIGAVKRVTVDMRRGTVCQNGILAACRLYEYEMDGYAITVCCNETGEERLTEITL